MSAAPTVSARAGGRRLSPRLRRAVLTLHIMVSVALLGDSAAFLAIVIRSGAAEVESVRAAGWDMLDMLSMVFGIPLSTAAILTGLVLGLGTKWGVFRYPWVVTKLALIVAVMAVGGLVISPGLELARDGAAPGETLLIAGAGFDVVALSVATVLSVYKPGAAWRPSRPRQKEHQ